MCKDCHYFREVAIGCHREANVCELNHLRQCLLEYFGVDECAELLVVEVVARELGVFGHHLHNDGQEVLVALNLCGLGG